MSDAANGRTTKKMDPESQEILRLIREEFIGGVVLGEKGLKVRPTAQTPANPLDVLAELLFSYLAARMGKENRQAERFLSMANLEISEMFGEKYMSFVSDDSIVDWLHTWRDAKARELHAAGSSLARD